jgi:hypothetical protein
MLDNVENTEGVSRFSSMIPPQYFQSFHKKMQSNPNNQNRIAYL